MEFLALALMGAVAGVLAGLLGIGGGAIIVPVLVFVFEMQHVDPGIIMHAALGTSLATIVFTSLSTVLTYQRSGTVNWKVFRKITPGILVGGLLGAGIADWLSSLALHVMFVLFMFFVAVQMSRKTIASSAHRGLPGMWGTTVAGTIIGAVSSIFGIGGASLSVPFMTWCSLSVRQAIATSSAIGMSVAASATAGYMILGLDEPKLPPWSIGYVVLPAFLGVVVASVLAAPFGARLSHRLSEVTLRRIFALFVTVLGIRMLWVLL
ncbi:MAG: sulfite exporter TauE/SafE family protein [Sulfuricaulis sp.]|uniref:sulfite exporter TauE/SafE family protein n=1 Tax=Sulfuricaulis sp. TaxID=2003553 RepID=UPI0034A0EA7D